MKTVRFRKVVETAPALIVSAVIAILPSALQADLVSYWNFDDGTTVTDPVGNNDGTLIHNAGFNTNTPDGCVFSLGLTATGVGAGQDYIRIGPAAEGGGEPAGRDLGISATNSFSISAWANYSASQRGIVTIKQDLTRGGGDRSGVTLGIGGDGEIFVGMIASDGDDTANSGATFRDITTDQIVPTGQ